jgi:hypothetical protein
MYSLGCSLITSVIVTDLSTLIRIIWFSTGALQLTILALVIARRHDRTLPMFAWFIGLNLAQAIGLFFVYRHYGFVSGPSFHIYWATEVISMIAQTLASAEILHRALQDYPGIWELTWRVILFSIIVTIGYAWATANSEGQWGLMFAVRGYYVIFAFAFVLCLLVVRHYSISIDPVYRLLLGGFCFYSCGSFVSDTLLKQLVFDHFPRYSDVWNESELLLYFATLLVWVVALRHPVGAEAQAPSKPTGGAYETMGPQLNAQLRELNDTLRKFFRRRVVES